MRIGQCKKYFELIFKLFIDTATVRNLKVELTTYEIQHKHM